MDFRNRAPAAPLPAHVRFIRRKEAARRAAHRLSVQRRTPCRDLIETALASTFDHATVLALASREHYAETCTRLIGITRARLYAEIIPALFGSDVCAFSCFRIAHAFGAVSADDAAITIALLRRRAKRGDERAAVALAAMPDGLRNWNGAIRTVRAAHLLGQIVRARRDGDAP